jgi:RNA polymerase sigma factor (sigma-70 family)
MVSDGELVTAVLRGDSAAFAELYRLHVRAVAVVIRDRSHDPDEVTDLIQETFVRALEGLPSLREKDRFRPWLLTIARHTVIDHGRASTRRGSVPEAVVEEEVPVKGAGPDEVAELRDLARLLSGCVASLSVRDATVVGLVTELDFSNADVASALGISAGAAKVVVHRARRRLRDALALELMVRRRGAGCDEFARLYDEGNLADAARHVRACPACDTQVHSDISLYGTRVAPVADRTISSPA